MEAKEMPKYYAEMSARLSEALSSDIPLLMANKMSSLFTSNFRGEGFFGQRWKEVGRRRSHTERYITKKGYKTRLVGPAKGAAGSRPILTGTGNLGRSIRWRTLDGEATVYSDLPYSAAHNWGTTTAGRGRHTVLPQRQFIGDHQALRQELTRLLSDEVGKLL